MYRYRIAYIALLLLLFAQACARTSPAPFSPLPPQDIHTEPPPFRIEKKDAEAAMLIQWKEFDVGGPDEAEKFLMDRTESIAQLTRPNVDPYTGRDSLLEMCKEKNLPKKLVKKSEDKKFSAVFFLYSSADKILGLCPSPKHLLKTQYEVLYCGKQKIYTIRYFYPLDHSWRNEPVATCYADQ